MVDAPGLEVQIRRSDPSETALLTEIAHAAKRHWGYPEEHIRLWAAELTLTPEFICENAVYSAVERKMIVGFYALVRDGSEWELEHLWVKPASMGRHVGKRLFHHAIDTARDGGARSVRIASDPNAEGFYLVLGAKRIGEVPSRPKGRSLPLLIVNVGSG